MFEFPNLRHSYRSTQISNCSVLGQNIVTFNRSQKIKDFTKSKSFLPKYSKKEAHSFRIIRKIGVRCTLTTRIDKWCIVADCNIQSIKTADRPLNSSVCFSHSFNQYVYNCFDKGCPSEKHQSVRDNIERHDGLWLFTVASSS